MSFYTNKTSLLKSLSLDDAFSFLISNPGFLHNPDFEIHSCKKVGFSNRMSKSELFLERAFNKDNPILIGPHEGRLNELFLGDAKPLIIGAYKGDKITPEKLKNSVSRKNKHDCDHAIDQIYFNIADHIFYIAENGLCSDTDYYIALGTILGYSETSISIFIARNISIDFSAIAFNKDIGLFNQDLGIFNKSSLPELNELIKCYSQKEIIFYSKNKNKKLLAKFIQELQSKNLLAENYQLVYTEHLDYINCDFVAVNSNNDSVYDTYVESFYKSAV